VYKSLSSPEAVFQKVFLYTSGQLDTIDYAIRGTHEEHDSVLPSEHNAIAEHEAKQISQRTKDALAAYKARGGTLGTPSNLTDEGRAKGQRQAGEASKAMADEAYLDIAPMMLELRNQGRTLREIAEALNKDGHTTRTGKTWNATQVMRVLDRVS
jgi:hypothetical protein